MRDILRIFIIIFFNIFVIGLIGYLSKSGFMASPVISFG